MHRDGRLGPFVSMRKSHLFLIVGLTVLVAVGGMLGTVRGGGDVDRDETIAMGPKFTAAVARYGCTEPSEAYQCLQTLLNEELDTNGPQAVLAIVNDLDAEIAPEPFACHPLVHGIGRRLVTNGGEAGLRVALAENDPVCESGFIHGSFEALGVLYSGEELERIVSAACQRTDGDTHIDCTHAGGHAFAIADPKDIDTAISRCTVFDPQSEDCARGVVMAYAIGSPKFSALHDPTWDTSWGWVGFDARQLNGACEQLRDDWQVPCWEFIWNGYVSHADRIGAEEYFAHCPERGAQHWDICVRNGGRLLLYGVEDDVEAVQQCSRLSGDRGQCLRGVALSLMLDDRYLGVDGEGRYSICSETRWTEDERESCLAGEQDAGES